MSSKSELPEINTLWVGGTLSYIELLTIKSAQSCGHQVNLYTYHGVENAPKDTIIKDAREVLPEKGLIQHVNKKKRSYALGSNIFRYEILSNASSLGYWADLDILFIKPLDFDKNYIFGLENENTINGAILYIAPKSDLMRNLIKYVYKRPCIPPWWPVRKKIIQKTLAFIGKEKNVENMKWGVFGPRALTHFIKELKLEHEAQPVDVFYPVHWKQADIFFDPNYEVEQHITHNTVTIHLWNEVIKKYKSAPPPEGSFIYKACKKHNIKF